jgi:hypothetical protein
VTIRSQARNPFPVLPFAVVATVVVALGLAVGLSQWDRGGSGTGADAPVSALAPSFPPVAPSAADALKADMAAHEAWTEAQFGPLVRDTVSADVVAAALAEHDNALAAVLDQASKEEASSVTPYVADR